MFIPLLAMQKLVITTITGGLLAASSAVAGDFSQPIAPQQAAAPVVTAGSLAVGYNSAYVYRGVNLGNDQVATQLTYGLDNLYMGQNLDLSAWYGSSEHTPAGVANDELRLTAATSRDLGFAKAHVGYTFYHRFTDQSNTHETFFGLSKELFGINASVTHFWAMDTDTNTSDNQGYTELGLSKSVNVYGNNINLGATVGYLVEEGEFSHATLRASYDYAIGNAVLSPYVAYSFELDDLEVFARSAQQNEFFAGASLRVNF